MSSPPRDRRAREPCGFGLSEDAIRDLAELRLERVRTAGPEVVWCVKAQELLEDVVNHDAAR